MHHASLKINNQSLCRPYHSDTSAAIFWETPMTAPEPSLNPKLQRSAPAKTIFLNFCAADLCATNLDLLSQFFISPASAEH
jgi:hypothetical protein